MAVLPPLQQQAYLSSSRSDAAARQGIGGAQGEPRRLLQRLFMCLRTGWQLAKAVLQAPPATARSVASATCAADAAGNCSRLTWTAAANHQCAITGHWS
jgi:hypothetical protein